MKADTFEKIIDFAINNEIEAYEFYRDAAIKVNDSHLKEVFEDLAKEELEHKQFLKDFANGELENIKLDEVSDYKIAETLDKPKLSVDMSFTDAISLAIKNEQEAMEMYNKLAAACLNEDHRNLFIELEKMEKMHKARLEDIYVNIAYAEVW